MKKTLLAAVALAAMAISVHADTSTNPKLVWGGGKQGASAYTDVYVPHIMVQLEAKRLSGYSWGGVSDGTIANAEKVTENPTHLAVGQLDLLKDIQGKPIPGKEGVNYQFTILKDNIGPECLYAVIKNKNYTTFGDVIGTSWDLSVVTGGTKSGSFGTWNVLRGVFPDLKDMAVEHAADAMDVVKKVGAEPGKVGFFVMRPDPSSKVFEAIVEQDLTLVPVVAFELESRYTVQELKVAYGGLLSSGKSLVTSCTSVALITGDPANAALADANLKKRLNATIERVSAIDAGAFVPDTSSWRDMLDSMKSVTGAKAQELKEASKRKLEEALKKVQGG